MLLFDSVDSTMSIARRISARHLDSIACDGLVIIARHQTGGRGRKGNAWTSPIGCAMFTLVLRVPLSSELGRHLSFLQHLASIACAQALQSLLGEDFKDALIRLKWPNDIYHDPFGRRLKLGGIYCQCSTYQQSALCSVGIGLNVANAQPTTCLNALTTPPRHFEPDRVIAEVVGHIERLVDRVQREGVASLLPLYYRHWMHSDQRIVFGNADLKQEGTVVGLDEFGFLRAISDDGSPVTIDSADTTIDMMDSLIARKIRPDI